MITHKAKNVSEYLSIIETLGIAEYVYRGQNEPYYSIQASGFRPCLGGWSSDKIFNMEHLHSAFYNRIIGQVSENEKKYFLAFCQHHGIPTNLIDMSYSPLVALFFSCDGKDEDRRLNAQKLDEQFYNSLDESVDEVKEPTPTSNDNFFANLVEFMSDETNRQRLQEMLSLANN